MNLPDKLELDGTKPARWVDPVLQELWQVKRAINVDANFDLLEIAKQANAQSLQVLLQQAKHSG